MSAVGEHLMSALPHVVLVIFVLGGVVGSAVPGFPGAILIMVGALVHGFWTGWEPLGFFWQAALAVLTLVSWGAGYVITAYGAKRYGASRWGVVGAALGMLVGLLLPIPLVGPLLGAFGGALAAELVVQKVRDGAGTATDAGGTAGGADAAAAEPTARDGDAGSAIEPGPHQPAGSRREGTRQAAKAGFGAALGAVLGLMAETGVALAMAGVIATAFLLAWIF